MVMSVMDNKFYDVICGQLKALVFEINWYILNVTYRVGGEGKLGHLC